MVGYLCRCDGAGCLEVLPRKVSPAGSSEQPSLYHDGWVDDLLLGSGTFAPPGPAEISLLSTDQDQPVEISPVEEEVPGYTPIPRERFLSLGIDPEDTHRILTEGEIVVLFDLEPLNQGA